MNSSDAGGTFRASRDFLLKHRDNYDAAVRGFVWPTQAEFNWALDYFDVVSAGNARPALHIVDEDGTETVRSFADLSSASNRVANLLRELGARRGDCLMLGVRAMERAAPMSSSKTRCRRPLDSAVRGGPSHPIQ